MYGLAKETDLDFLLGRELSQLCVGFYVVNLELDERSASTLGCEVGSCAGK